MPLRGTPMIESYLELIGHDPRVTQEHEILIAVQVDARSAPRRETTRGMQSLIEQTERMSRRGSRRPR